MDLLTFLVILTSSLVLLSILLDRIVQLFGYSLGFTFDVIELLSAMLGVVVHSLYAFGTIWTLAFIGVTIGLSWVIEGVGLRTGFPFGRYRYTEVAGVRLPGGVPVAVVIMWWMILYASLFPAILLHHLLIGVSISPWTLSLFVAMFATLWDASGDPVAVDGKMWIWENEGRWMGIPLSNYFGWFATAFLVSLTVLFLVNAPLQTSDRPWQLLFLPLIGYAALQFHFGGAAIHRRLPLAAIIALLMAAVYIVLYLFIPQIIQQP